MNKDKKRHTVWLTPDAWNQVETSYTKDNCTTKNEYIEKAIRFYTGYLNTQDAVSYLPRVLADVLEGKLGAMGTRIGKLLFKLVVEQDMTSNITAAVNQIPLDDLERLRVRCIRSAPTRGNASEFITRAIEDNMDALSKRENYVDYIAKRPRAERFGAHGLFTGTDDPLVLSQVAEAVASHPGNVWLPIISLRREDAARLGYDSAAAWKHLLTSCAPQLAEAMKIPMDQFCWYAALPV